MESFPPDIWKNVGSACSSPALAHSLAELIDTVHQASLYGMNAIISERKAGEVFIGPFQVRIISDSQQPRKGLTVKVSAPISKLSLWVRRSPGS